MYRRLLIGLIVMAFLAVGITYSCVQKEEPEPARPGTMAHNSFVGEQTCRSCHTDVAQLWDGSHHDYAMKRADTTSVRGNFNNQTFVHQGKTYRFFKEDSLFMVEAPVADGKTQQYHITHTFGWEPLQQYLVDYGQGKLQALNIAWDTEQKEWFVLNPKQDLQHGDWMHWTGGAMNWNSMCADCHSTNLQQNYIPSADSFNTTWSDINVSCEACHGPGKDHVTLMKSEDSSEATIQRIRKDLNLTADASQMEQLNQCAQCHALREELTDDYAHEGDFFDHYNLTLLNPDSYFADGQIKGEVYVYGSFLQSKMFKEGVECTDCHDPHTLELKANIEDNSLCMNCHVPKYNTKSHHFHEENTEASQCVNCHMTGRYYMEVDFRRDHSFQVPRPDQSAQFGTPNACNNCHDQQTAEWAANAIDRWYGPDREAHFSDVILKANAEGAAARSELEQLAADTINPDIARATAIWYLGQFSDSVNSKLFHQALRDSSTIVRASAARAIGNFSSTEKEQLLQDALDDSMRTVRVGAAGGLAEFSVADIAMGLKNPFRKAMKEYKRYLEVSQYFPQGLMNRGQFYEKRGRPEDAIKAYQRVLEKDPKFNPARINLAYLRNQQGNNRRAEELFKKVIEQEPGYGPAYYSLALLLGEVNRVEEALQYFEMASEKMPENPQVFYNWAIALQKEGQPKQSEEAYLKAIDLAPDNMRYRYGISTLYVQQGQYQKAMEQAKKLKERFPNNSRVPKLMQLLQNEMN